MKTSFQSYFYCFIVVVLNSYDAYGQFSPPPPDDINNPIGTPLATVPTTTLLIVIGIILGAYTTYHIRKLRLH